MTIKWQDNIEERKEVMTGKPVFKGTRLTVEFILKQIGAGATNEDLLNQYRRSGPSTFVLPYFTLLSWQQ